MKSMVKMLALVPFLILAACGGQTMTQSDADALALDTIDEVVDASNPGGLARMVAEVLEAKVKEHEPKVIKGQTGTLTVSFDVDRTDPTKMIRTRTLVFDKFTRGNRKLSNITGTLTYTFTAADSEVDGNSITRTLKGEIIADVTKKDGTVDEGVTLTYDITFTRDSTTKCAEVTGTVKLAGQSYTFNKTKDTTRCKTNQP